MNGLHPSYERLMAMEPIKGHRPPLTTPKSGVYLFSEQGKHLYVGRSNRLRARHWLHCGPSSKENQSSFAWKITAEILDFKATYRKGEGRKDMMLKVEYMDVFFLAKERIRNMEYRYVEETDQTRQALLEAYVSIVLGTPYNDFNTH